MVPETVVAPPNKLSEKSDGAPDQLLRSRSEPDFRQLDLRKYLLLALGAHGGDVIEEAQLNQLAMNRHDARRASRLGALALAGQLEIGVTGGNLNRRFTPSELDPTFLMAAVDVVATYKLYNITGLVSRTSSTVYSVERSSTLRSSTGSVSRCFPGSGSWCRASRSTKPSTA